MQRRLIWPCELQPQQLSAIVTMIVVCFEHLSDSHSAILRKEQHIKIKTMKKTQSVATTLGRELKP
jgi:hypothetical protein